MRCISSFPWKTRPAARLAWLLFVVPLTAGPASGGPADLARQLLAAAGIRGGLIVHLGCGDGRLTAKLRGGPSFVVQGLDRDAASVARAREVLRSGDLYGPVSVDRLTSAHLPYVDNLVNLVVAERLEGVSTREVMRVLTPGGVALIKRGNHWAKRVKPRPQNIDEWTHYLHDATGNPVAHDQVVGPPAHLQWVGSPRWSRNHDRMASMSALVSSGGRIFYIMDEGSRISVILPSHWKILARDAFNGTLLWKRDLPTWWTRLWPLKSGPVQLTRRLVAVDPHVYVTLGLHAPVSCLDAASGRTVRVYAGTSGTEEIIASRGVLFLLVNPAPKDTPFVPDRSGVWNDTQRVARNVVWQGRPRRVKAVDAATGVVLWERESPVAPMTLAADATRVYFHDGARIHALDRRTGTELWRSEPVSRRKLISLNFGPNLIAVDDVVVFSGGDRLMTALRADTGEKLWSAPHPPSGHASQQDLLVIEGLVWSGDTAGGNRSGVFQGRDLHTGEVKVRFPPDVKTYWFHHRCYRSKATDRFLIPARTGTEFVDFRKRHWTINHWIRGGCIYGVMPANGLLYAPPHDCACYLEAKLFGFNAVAAESETRRVPRQVPASGRLERGPAYLTRDTPGAANPPSPSHEWPTYRHDAARSGATSAEVSSQLVRAWDVKLPGPLTSVVCAGGRVFVASKATHTLFALEQNTGRTQWTYTAGGRIDSPPTLWRGRVLFGCADGWVYCLRASEGTLCWRFRAAPSDRRLVAWEQVESPWPVSGSVLIQYDPAERREVLYCVAGRSAFLDGGMRLLRLDPATGEKLSETLLDNRDPKTGKDLQDLVKVLNMPEALPDVLSSDGRHVYMREQRFTLGGKREQATPVPTDPVVLATEQQGDDRHLFSPVGFLDDSWFHRSYWLYGRRYSEGCNWWSHAGRYTPAGRLLVFDDRLVYGYGRKRDYFQWSVPLDYHLFACSKNPSLRQIPPTRPGIIAVAKSPTLNPAGTPVTVEAWVFADQGDGVALARGGASHGYALMLRGGKPRFLVRIDNALHAITGKEPVTGRWVHLAGVLTQTKELQLFVDGELAGTAKVPGFITADPNEAMELGTDRGSPVGEYKQAPLFHGRLDEVRIYHRALSPAEVASHAGGKTDVDRKGLALYYSFTKGSAHDDSGNGNNGSMGAAPAPGKFGQGAVFNRVEKVSRLGPRKLARRFQDRWSVDCPIYVRAMVLAGSRLFIAGPPDVLDEEEAYHRPDDPDTEKQLTVQDEAVAGRRGASLLVLEAATGKRLARFDLDSPPTWDGMAAVDGRLFLTTLAGKVVCLRD